MFELHRLGWQEFQNLSATIVREIFGQTALTFLNTRDGGRDGAFCGAWTSPGGDRLTAAFVVQCKHFGSAGRLLRPSDLKDELPKARRLHENGRCDIYILMTNAGVSGPVEEAIAGKFRAIGIDRVLVYGREWICQQIRERKRLRMLVPRIYGLGDLSQILDGRAYDQGMALLAALQEDLSRLVVTGAYRRAAAALEDHGFVLLIGEPAAGKTTIAASLAMAAVDQWGCSTIKITEPGELRDRWNPQEPKQFFWIDDAFGAMQYEAHRVFAWNAILPHVAGALRSGARIVMTSRDYIYRAARPNLKVSAFPLLQESRVVIDVRELTIGERERILYNHLKFGDQPRRFRATVKPYLPGVAAHKRFAPEIARRLAHPLFTRNLELNKSGLADFVRRREHLLKEVIEGLDSHSRAGLALIYMGGGELPSPIILDDRRADALARLDSDLGKCTTALRALDDSLVRRVFRDGRNLWIFKHPTIGDAYAELLLANPELIGIYLAGTPIERILDQITCGRVGIRGAVIVPRSLYALVLARLDQLIARGEDWRIDLFLATRCDREFLALFLQHHPGLLERIRRPWLQLDASGEVQIAMRLHKLKLLPDDVRRSFVNAVMDYAVEGEDGYLFRNDALRAMLSSEDQVLLKVRLQGKLIPNLGDARHRWEGNYESRCDPADHMSGFLDILDSLKSEFNDDAAVVGKITHQEHMVQEWISEQDSETGGVEDYGRLAEDPPDPSARAASGGRSIFDDVDQ